MSRRRWLAGVTALVATGLVLVAAPGRSGAQAGPSDDPTREVLAVVSPIASPACQVAGAATLLVPVISGLVAEQAGQVPVPIDELALDALSPVFVVCADLPAAPGSRCQIDDQIATLWPAEAGQFLSSPNLVGNLVDALGAALDLLGLPTQGAVHEALVCAVPESSADDTPPPSPPPAPPPAAGEPATGPTSTAPPPVAAPVTGGGFAPPTLDGPATPRAPTVGEAPPPVAPPAVLASIARRVPGGLLALQVAAAVLLAVFLGSSWATSLRLARR